LTSFPGHALFFDLEVSNLYNVQVFDCLCFPKGFAYFTGTKSAKIFYYCLRNNNNNRGDWNSLKITQALPEQHTRKGRDQGTTKTAILGTYTLYGKY
jgi:hypothetical protein